MRSPRRLGFIVVVAVIIIIGSTLLSLSRMTRPAKWTFIRTVTCDLDVPLSSSEVAVLKAYSESAEMRADAAARLERAGVRAHFDPIADLDWLPSAHSRQIAVRVQLPIVRERFNILRFSWLPDIDHADKHALKDAAFAALVSILVKAHGLVDAEEKRRSIRMAVEAIDAYRFTDGDELRDR